MRIRFVVPMLALALLSSLAIAADEPAQVTLKGILECAKCALHETTTCQNVLSVKDGDKEVKYYLVDNKLSKDNHAAICAKPMSDVSVTGTIEDKDGKKMLTASKIELPAAK